MKNEETSRRDDETFEQSLREQSVRRIPAAWREGILTNAQNAASTVHAPRATHHGFLSTLTHKLSALSQLQRIAWSCLAATWVVIAVMNFSSRDDSNQTMAKISRPSPEAIAAWRNQRRELANLVESPQPRSVETHKPQLPQPRSCRREEILTA